jgi:predicted nucleic acid-binding protein
MIFIDTCAFLARYLVKDQHHKNALKKWSKLQKSNSKMYTSNFVLDEMITLLGRWVGADFAIQKAYSIYHSESFVILRPDETDEFLALGLCKKFSDKRISFTDCISFSLMKRHKIENVFSFDRHFTDAGFSHY